MLHLPCQAIHHAGESVLARAGLSSGHVTRDPLTSSMQDESGKLLGPSSAWRGIIALLDLIGWSGTPTDDRVVGD